MKTYTQLKKEHGDWLWEADFRYSVEDFVNWYHAVKEAKRIEIQLRMFKSENLFREVA